MRTYVKYTVIYHHKDKYSISAMCKCLNVSRSGYYDYVKRMDIRAKDLSLAEKYENVNKKHITHTAIDVCMSGLRKKVFIIIRKRY